MRFKSGKFWFSIGFSALALAHSPIAHAMLVSLSSPGNGSNGNIIGAIGPTPSPSPVNTTGQLVFYFPATSSGASPAIGGTGTVDPQLTSGGLFKVLDIFQDETTDPYQVVFTIQTNQDLSQQTTGSNYYLMVTTSGGSVGGQTSVTEPVPIIGFGPGVTSYNAVPLCSSNPSGYCTSGFSEAGHMYYHAALADSGNVYQVALNMKAIYIDFNALSPGNFVGGGFTNLFGDASPAPPSDTYTNRTQFTLTFGIYSLPPTNATCAAPWCNNTIPPANPVDSATVTLNFATRGPASGTFGCNLASAYYPGDAQINVDGTQFSMQTATQDSAPDGLYRVAVLAQEQGSVPPIINGGTGVNIAYVASNPSGVINARALPQPGQPVTGFTNSTDSTKYNYAVGFAGIDEYGFIVDGTVPSPVACPPTSESGCDYQCPVQVAQILGFLNSSKCFIATAAFREDSPALAMLRSFRDQILEKFPAGRLFIHWYYAWSPPAAEWLIDHPIFRYPILLLLVPLQVFAWLTLHPEILALLGLLATAVIGAALKLRAGTREENRG